ncbi:hypothetical protein BWZ20_06795 [Winogradskyella sp. J14-2]|uniref:sulfotransferase n=1 Tax=Winogradskyella sp. J14-2 TaxID=1936080 RepID=UPI0009729DBD|nr:sulfotransferase [Winogradskyella sp. J14-2]APY08025.1 hypothetical protein BWZ20_06795 [Winogradskyella sp. J14-2]
MINKLKSIYSKLLSFKYRTTNKLFGNKDYKKFVIISTSRTGSTLVMALLNNHKNVICDGELFKNLNGKSCKHVWNDFFNHKPKDTQQVGFKLFYSHPRDDDKTVWDIIKQDKSIKIIHLMRRNILRIFLSQRIGIKTKRWTENVNRPHNISLESKKVDVDYKECTEAFNKITDYQNKTKQMFKEHDYLEVYYEDIVNDRESELDKIFDFLDVEKMQVTANNKKQNPERIDELINNYEELKNKFTNTKWEYLFEN